MFSASYPDNQSSRFHKTSQPTRNISNVSPKCHPKCHSKCTPYVIPNVTPRSQYVTAACGETSAPEEPTFVTDLCTEATGWLASPPEINTGLAGGEKFARRLFYFCFSRLFLNRVSSGGLPKGKKLFSSAKLPCPKHEPNCPPIACVGHTLGTTGPHFTTSFA